jgi:ATP-dependent DNA helicase PIF1
MPISLTREQQVIIDAIQSGFERVIRVSGPAGSGKSVVVNELKRVSNNIIYCAPTGLASSLIGGQTVHKTFGMPSGFPLDPNVKCTILRQSEISTKFFGGKKAAPLVSADWIVVDECSMLRADHLDFINSALQHARGSSAPFGGCGILLVGDNGQLPPVASGGDIEAFNEWGYAEPYGIDQSRSLEGVKTYSLTRIFRQQSRAEGELFSRIRTAQQSNLDLRILNRCVGRPHPRSVTLTPYRAIAKRVNERELSKLNGEEFEFTVEKKGWVGEDPVKPLKLRRGARAMTIHSSQGSTLRRVYIDLPPTKPFTTGLLYVAISRVTSMAGLRLSRKVRHADVASAVQGEIKNEQEEFTI